MARPIKNNAEYFSHDADMRNDIKVKALRRRFGHKGYAVWCFLLESLTDAENFVLNRDAVSVELLAADYDVSVEELTGIIEYCVKIELLQISDDDLLYSAAHQRRFNGLIQNRERKRQNRNIGKADTGGNGDVMARQNPSETTSVDGNGDAKHSSKGKESKEEEKKEKESKVVVPYAAVIELWNTVCSAYPKVVKLTDSRRTKIKLRLGEFSGDPEQWLPMTRQLFDRVQASNFLHGDNRNGWSATFDWLFENSGNWVKVMEGNYDNKGGYRPAQQRVTTTSGVTLGVGEYIDETGRRTYGTGRATIPLDAPARPSERYSWDAGSKTWVML